MSESRNASESRGYSYVQTYPVYGGESRDASESRVDVSRNETYSQYNSLDDVDKLIERLEVAMPLNETGSARFNQALDRRRKQIEELKQLRNQARQQIEEDERIREIEQQNAEIDAAINGVKRLLKKTPTKPSKGYISYSSESRGISSGESRW